MTKAIAKVKVEPHGYVKELEPSAVRIDELRMGLNGTVMEIGHELTKAQDKKADHVDGVFVGWIKKRCKYSVAQAYNYINAYKEFTCFPNFRKLADDSAIYLLSAPSTPEPVRKKAIAKGEARECVTHTWTKKEVKERKSGERAGRHGGDRSEMLSLQDFGVTTIQSSRWQRIASIPKESPRTEVVFT